MTETVIDNPTESRFEIRDGDRLAAWADYVRTNSSVALTHTEVDDAFAGRGLAKSLTAGALAHARDHGLAVLPKCPFVAKYIKRNPEWLDLVPEGRRADYDL